MEKMDALFDRMDAWRHLPGYQLERRADLFFSLYLPEVLEAKFGFPVSKQIIPEFPVHIGTIYPEKPTNQSYQIDYLALSADSKTAILVELKTDPLQQRPKQDTYLSASCTAGLPALLYGVLDIFRATTSKRKYFALLKTLESMSLLEIPSEMNEIMTRPRLQGANEASRGIEITTSTTECRKIYILPNGERGDTISFEDFRSVVKNYEDPVSRRFAQSLSEWARVKAGEQDTKR